MVEQAQGVADALEQRGFQARVVPIERGAKAIDEIQARISSGEVSRKLYPDYFSGFDEKVPTREIGFQSIVIVAAPQFPVKVGFMVDGRPLTRVVPPTYNHHSDRTIGSILRDYFGPRGGHALQARLPLKVLAVRSGLARYGRNNISYIEGLGSFFRLAAFYTDAAYGEDPWSEPLMLDECRDCDLCLKACPAGVISEDRFLVQAERCLTFFNENDAGFPEWIDPAWHNALVGCLKCQRVCPANRHLANGSEGGGIFTESETAAILRTPKAADIPDDLSAKLDRLGLKEYFAVLNRNLRVLMRP